MSCNGCRALRRGCADDCTLRPCLQWINSPESQVNATLFLAKFYGRAGLINLISVGPTHLHPETFRSLLYEACGRIINPVHGSVGLLSSGNWPRCQAAVEAVLHGGAPLLSGHNNDSVATLGRARARIRSKRSAARGKCEFNSVADGLTSEPEAKFTISGWDCGEEYGNLGDDDQGLKRAASHDSFSVETVEPALANRYCKPDWGIKPESQPGEIGLELTLGTNHVRQTYISTVIDISDSE
ncbi:LOB domain-containing protein 41 [Phtheirospermum japonicum]|uniref:LOB domain-containing protein 41 n=1 Tax=Phtheirospermum japonicum TaxID=374723 RepID=A0A830BDZ1_9LAMI|nr:LOB domain-containing protein 41 [Phtheirospermum japonicum]